MLGAANSTRLAGAVSHRKGGNPYQAKLVADDVTMVNDRLVLTHQTQCLCNVTAHSIIIGGRGHKSRIAAANFVVAKFTFKAARMRVS